MVTFGNHQSVVTNAGYPNDPRKLSAESWCLISLKFLEWRMMVFWQQIFLGVKRVFFLGGGVGEYEVEMAVQRHDAEIQKCRRTDIIKKRKQCKRNKCNWNLFETAVYCNVLH